jgi:glycosyltransferase involved in cell wall biosynthesis
VKIGFLNILYSKPAERGGLGAHIVTLSRELARRGHAVTVITSGNQPPSIEHGVTILPVGPVERYEGASQLVRPSYVRRRLAYMWRAAQAIRNVEFDLVEVADGGVEHLFLLAKRSCPLVMKLHGSFQDIHQPPHGLSSAMLALEGYALRHSDAIYTSSEQYASTVAQAYRMPRERIRVIPYGIDLRDLDVEPRQRAVDRFPALAGKRIVLLSVGSSVVRKGGPIFVEMARRYQDPSVRFVLLCSDVEAVQRLAPPANVLVINTLDKADFYGLLAASDVAVFPSEFESFSIATYEAMLLGRTVVVSRSVPLEGPARAYPRRLTLDCLDADCLGDAVRQVLAGEAGLCALQPEQLTELRRAYSIEAVAEQTLSYYEEIVDRYRRSAT